MKSVLIICLMVGVIKLSECLVCPKNFCDSVDCSDAPTADKCRNGVIQEKGSYCGCCPICMKYIPVGGSCSHLHLRGTPRTSTCEPPSVCVDGTCALQEESEAYIDLSAIAEAFENEEPVSERTEEEVSTLSSDEKR